MDTNGLEDAPDETEFLDPSGCSGHSQTTNTSSTPTRRSHRPDQIAEIGWVLPGSITERFTRCGNPTCRCRAEPPRLHGSYPTWTRKVDNKTVTRTLTAEQAERYRPWLDNARRLRALLTELEALSVHTANITEGWGREMTAETCGKRDQ